MWLRTPAADSADARAFYDQVLRLSYSVSPGAGRDRRLAA
jgi:hypothetical protein